MFADLRAASGANQPVTMTGVRLDESSRRGANIRERGESATEIWRNDKGRLGLSPIIHWSADDVFEYLGYASAGMSRRTRTSPARFSSTAMQEARAAQLWATCDWRMPLKNSAKAAAAAQEVAAGPVCAWRRTQALRP